MCRTSASGCSRVAAPAGPALSLAQSVLDLVEVDLRFTLRGFAEGDDADFMLDLRVDDGHRSPGQQTKGDEPMLAVREPVVLEREREAIEHVWSIDEVEPMSFKFAARLAFDQVNSMTNVYTDRHDVKGALFRSDA